MPLSKRGSTDPSTSEIPFCLTYMREVRLEQKYINKAFNSVITVINA